MSHLQSTSSLEHESDRETSTAIDGPQVGDRTDRLFLQLLRQALYYQASGYQVAYAKSKPTNLPIRDVVQIVALSLHG